MALLLNKSLNRSDRSNNMLLILLIFFSAAHCFNSKAEPGVSKHHSKVIAKIGGFDLNNHEEKRAYWADISKIVVHHDFDSTATTFDADLAMLVTTDQIKFSEYIQPVCLWDSDVLPSETEALVAGWGTSENKTLEPLPKKLRLKIHDYESCIKDHPDLVQIASSRSICGGDGKGSGACYGDSGNGLFIEHNNHFYIRGTVSSTATLADKRCDTSQYSVYTNVLKFADWIRSFTELAEYAGNIYVVPNCSNTK